MNYRYLTIGLLGLLMAGCDGDGNALVNNPPTISAIADQSTMANAPSAAIPFTIGDEQVGSVAIGVSSDNQGVVPDAGLLLGGSGATRTLTVMPVTDTLGDAFVTIIVTDSAGLAASTSFLLTVIPQQVSMLQFTRTTFAAGEADEPVLINAVAFDQDADGDDFADLLAQ